MDCMTVGCAFRTGQVFDIASQFLASCGPFGVRSHVSFRAGHLHTCFLPVCVRSSCWTLTYMLLASLCPDLQDGCANRHCLCWGSTDICHCGLGHEWHILPRRARSRTTCTVSSYTVWLSQGELIAIMPPSTHLFITYSIEPNEISWDEGQSDLHACSLMAQTWEGHPLATIGR